MRAAGCTGCPCETGLTKQNNKQQQQQQQQQEEEAETCAVQKDTTAARGAGSSCIGGEVAPSR